MTEEKAKVKRLTCDVCGFKDQIESKGFLTPKTPDTWGYDIYKKDQMCPTCMKKYREGYLGWYSQFKSERKDKKGEE